MSTSDTKKRKSGVPTLREWEKVNLERFALSKLKALSNFDKSVFQDKLDGLETEIKRKKRKETVYIRKGYESVTFFLKNPKLIPVAKKEMAMRSAARYHGEDMLYYEFKDPTLSRHCRLQATAIFTRNDTSCEDCSYSYHYLQVRNNYAETMGRACMAAEQALLLYKRLKEQEIQQPKEQKNVIQNDFLQQMFPNYWEEFNRPSEEKVNELLANRCDDYVDDDSDNTSLEPQKITKQKYVQTEFDFQNQCR